MQNTRSGKPVNSWRFGAQEVRTKVYVWVPDHVEQFAVDLVQLQGLPESQKDRYDVADLLEA
jgi:hypothetical protein